MDSDSSKVTKPAAEPPIQQTCTGFVVNINFHTKDALVRMHPEQVKWKIAEALEHMPYKFQEEVDFTLEIYRAYK